jgi:hypothetical protein
MPTQRFKSLIPSHIAHRRSSPSAIIQSNSKYGITVPCSDGE